MKNKIIYISLTAVLFLGSCRKDKDLFVSPNNPTDATPQTLLTSIEVGTMNTYEGDLNRSSSLFIQHNVGVDGQYLQVQRYQLDESIYNNQWAQLYQTLLTCKVLDQKYSAKNPYYGGINEIMMAMNWGVLTDLWGDIPYSEALAAEANYTPKYDPQQTVITGILGMLDDAIVKLSQPSGDNVVLPAGDDIIFNGDAGKWIKTAYTLKARYLNRLSNKGSYDPNAILTSLSSGIQSSADNCMAIHGTGGNEQNQWFAFLNQGRIYMGASNTLLDSMQLRPQDERVYYYYDSSGGGTITGSPIDVPSQSASLLGPYLAGGPDVSTPLVTYTEAKFIEAEVKARQNDPTTFQVLNDAITESCITVTGGVYNGSTIATYTAGTANLSRVMYEKWIAMFGQLEAFNDYRRTKLPALTPNPDGVISIIPQRFPTPQSERTTNPNALVPALSTPVWWAQ
ncbi:SusD/RagB family nutrient-binding outer membrane lipoprotein [Chitinophagaceae bacterium MMS25-I14]